MSSRIVWVLLALGLGVLTPASPTWAEDPPSTDAGADPEDALVVKARQIRERAEAHYGEARYGDAKADYAEAVRLLRTRQGDHEELATGLNGLALAHLALGNGAAGVPILAESLAMTRRLFKGDHRVVARRLNNLATVLVRTGQDRQAVPMFEEALAMSRRLYPGDHEVVATGLNSLARALRRTGKIPEARTMVEEALAMRKRLFKGDHPSVAASAGVLAGTLFRLGKATEALAMYEDVLAMRKRLIEGDSAAVAQTLSNMAIVLIQLGKDRKALSVLRESLAMHRRMVEGDDDGVAHAMNGLAILLQRLGKLTEALPVIQESLEMQRRLSPGDNPYVATSLNNLAGVLDDLGRREEALAYYEDALLMQRRLFNGDHPEVARGLGNLANVLQSVGRISEALPMIEEALQMKRRLFTGDHPTVAVGLGQLASVLDDLGRGSDALPLYEEALAMNRRLFPGDHPDVARALNNLASALRAVGRDGEALQAGADSLAMTKRLLPDDHPEVATGMNNLAFGLLYDGRASEALALFREAHGMRARLFSGDHPDVAHALHNVAQALFHLGQDAEAKQRAQEAVEMAARMRWADEFMPRVLLGRLHLKEGDAPAALLALQPAAAQLEARRAEASTLGSEGRARYLASLRKWDPFPLLVQAHAMTGETERALEVLERGRGREMLDLLERGEGDPLKAAVTLATERGDEQMLKRIDEINGAVRETSARIAVAVRGVADAGASRKKRKAARKVEREARGAHEDALRGRLTLIRETLPAGRPLAAAEVKALMAPGERLLAYSLGRRSFVFLVSREGVAAHALEVDAKPVSASQIAEAVADYRERLARRGGTPKTAKDHGGAALFRMLMPDAIWSEVKAASRLHVLPHGALHQLPFEALVVQTRAQKPVYWLEEGPPLAYAASAAVLAALRARPKAAKGLVRVVALGDPVFRGATGWPAKGVVVTGITPASQAAHAGLRPGDVITSYGGKATGTFAELVAALRGTDPASVELIVGLDREGAPTTVVVKPGRLGVLLAREPPPIAGPKLLAQSTIGAHRGTTRRGLVPLPGTRNEVDAIVALIEGSAGDASIQVLLGAQATEAALFDAADSPRIVHLATHGLIEPAKGARASRLALTPPRVPVPGNDGFLSLGDLLERWRARLKGTELVVLSACDSHSGKLDANEGMLALPWGFCFSGARSCISSLWQVDDKSTAVLMTGLYRGLFDGSGASACDALHAARRELMKSHPDPYYWAPFIFSGAP